MGLPTSITQEQAFLFAKSLLLTRPFMLQPNPPTLITFQLESKSLASKITFAMVCVGQVLLDSVVWQYKVC